MDKFFWHSFRLLLPVLALLANAIPLSAQATLRYRYRENEVRHYLLEQRLNYTLTLSGSGKKSGGKIISILNITWRTLSVNKEGAARVKIKINRTRYNTSSSDDQKIQYDSQDGKLPEGKAGKILSNFLVLSKHDVIVTVDSQGTFSNLVIPKEMLESFRSEASPKKEIEDNFYYILRQINPAFPLTTVKKGTSWKKEFPHDIPVLDEGTIESEYTYFGQITKRNKEFQHISIKPFVAFLFKNGLKDKYRITTSLNKGAAYFDIESGGLAEMQHHLIITLQGAGGELQMDREIILKLQ